MDITTRDWQLYSAWQQSQNGALTSVTIRALLILGPTWNGLAEVPLNKNCHIPSYLLQRVNGGLQK